MVIPVRWLAMVKVDRGIFLGDFEAKNTGFAGGFLPL
jgi:hypothetical protein